MKNETMKHGWLAALGGLTLGVLGVAATPASAASEDAAGFLYGKVTLSSGKVYEGRLRWDDEEAAWGDLFHSAKRDNEWVDLAPRRERERRKTIRVFGVDVSVRSDDWSHGRQFVIRFGDIESIEPRSGDRATVRLKSGTEVEVDGGSNDIGAEIVVWDPSFGDTKLDWDRIDRIEFLPVPKGYRADDTRLHGTVRTREGDFTGFVQWDQQECLGSDKLDGEDRDGDVSLRMGTLRAIERRSSSSSRVILRDGREMVLDGTNDVDDSNRGIYVEDPRFGRVLISWDVFERVDFTDAGSGPGYDSFPPGQPLRGTVTDIDGRKLSGRIVYDLDESETTELLDGERRDIDYSIPFALVAAIEPRDADASRVTLRGGEQLVLEGTADVSEDNAGVLVFESGRERPTYVRWSDVERIDFDHGPVRAEADPR
jgi:hypothetical protein